MQIGTLPVGQIRYDRMDANTAQISLSIARGFRGRSLGARLLGASAEWAARELGVRWLQGAVKTDNEASRRVFLKAGFECSEQATPTGGACWVFRRPAHVGSPREDCVASH
jgi:RimJ/RimL family protein N-acetyltransferase